MGIQWKESTTGKPTRTKKVTGFAMAMAIICLLKNLKNTGKTLFMKETLLTIKDMDSELCLGVMESPTRVSGKTI